MFHFSPLRHFIHILCKAATEAEAGLIRLPFLSHLFATCPSFLFALKVTAWSPYPHLQLAGSWRGRATARPGTSCGCRSVAKKGAGCPLALPHPPQWVFLWLVTTSCSEYRMLWLHQGSPGGFMAGPEGLPLFCLPPKGCSGLMDTVRLVLQVSCAGLKRWAVTEHRHQHGVDDSTLPQPGRVHRQAWVKKCCVLSGLAYSQREGASGVSVPGSNMSKGQLCSAACPHPLPSWCGSFLNHNYSVKHHDRRKPVPHLGSFWHKHCFWGWLAAADRHFFLPAGKHGRLEYISPCSQV